MDFIRKQSLISTIIQIGGALLGGLSTIFIYPNDLRLYGVYGFLTNTASLLVPFISLGFGAVLIRYYPYFKETPNASRFFGFVLLGYLLGILLFAFAFISFFPCLKDILSSGDLYIKPFVFFVFPFSVLYVLFEMLSNVFINFQKLALPAFFVFLMKLLLPFLFILSFKNYLTGVEFIGLICIYYVIVIGFLLYKISQLFPIQILIDNSLWKLAQRDAMLRFALFSILGGASAILALRIDSILVTSFLGVKANGLFTLAIFISNVAFIPASSLTDGLNALVSGLSKENANTDLKKIYSKSSVNMLIPTVWISICIYTGFVYLSQLMPNPEEIIKIERLIAWLLLARLVDAATGINHYMLAYSRFYILELYLLILMALLNIVFNLLLLPILGIEGVALATFLSVCIYNLVKTAVVYYKLGLHPFTKSWLKLIIIILLCLFILSQIHFTWQPIYALMTQSLIATVLFLGAVIALRISTDFNALLLKLAKNIKIRLKSILRYPNMD